MSTRSALILGSTGLIGGHLLQLLIDDPVYDLIRILVRKPQPSPHPKVEVHVIDFEQLEESSQLFAVTDVFCCLGTTMKKAGSKERFLKVDFEYPKMAAAMAKAVGARQYLLVSALGANEGSSVFYNQVKGKIESAVREIGFSSTLIFQPSLLLGDRNEQRLGEKFGIVVYKLTRFLWVGPLRKFRGIEASKVAQAMHTQAKAGLKGAHIFSNEQMS